MIHRRHFQTSRPPQSRRARSLVTSARAAYLLEALEPREVFSASYATLVIDIPRNGVAPVQTDQNAQHAPAVNGATLDSALDIQVRILAGGINITVAASSLLLMTQAPTGTIDIYDESQFLGTVALGGAVRSTIVIPAGEHTFFATYIGDANFHPSNASITTTLPNPTATLPLNAADNNDYATNSSGERIRASRFLSNINFFDANSMAVAAIPPVPGGFPPTSGVSSFSLSPGDPIPTPRFSKITFSLKLPKIPASH